jgi:hypothetical protein
MLFNGLIIDLIMSDLSYQKAESINSPDILAPKRSLKYKVEPAELCSATVLQNSNILFEVHIDNIVGTDDDSNNSHDSNEIDDYGVPSEHPLYCPELRKQFVTRLLVWYFCQLIFILSIVIMSNEIPDFRDYIDDDSLMIRAFSGTVLIMTVFGFIIFQLTCGPILYVHNVGIGLVIISFSLAYLLAGYSVAYEIKNDVYIGLVHEMIIVLSLIGFNFQNHLPFIKLGSHIFASSIVFILAIITSVYTNINTLTPNYSSFLNFVSLTIWNNWMIYLIRKMIGSQDCCGISIKCCNDTKMYKVNEYVYGLFGLYLFGYIV